MSTTPEEPSSSTPQSQSQSQPSSSIFSARSAKQFSLFLAGATFLSFSSVLTRRALVRRRRMTVPKYFFPSNDPHLNIHGGGDAFEALSIASINVASFSIMMIGGVLWGLNVSTLDDLRFKLRRSMGVQNVPRSEQEINEELEEWVASTLARKERKEKERDGKADQGGR